MSKTQEYKILIGNTKYQIDELVNAYISKGWQPCGNPCVTANGYSCYVSQAVEECNKKENRIGEYKLLIVRKADTNTLEEKIKKYIDKGWAIFGNHCISLDDNGQLYIVQAVVQYKK